MQYELNQLRSQKSCLLQYVDQEKELFVIGMKGLQFLQNTGSYNHALQPLHTIAQWATDFLCNPHPELGRKGAVCPYTKPSIDKELFWLSLFDKPSANPAQIMDLMVKYRDIFHQLPPQEGKDVQYKTILVVFPHFTQKDCNALIDDVQLQLKSEFVAQGLMIGQFYASCPQGGLWNENFKPLRSPLPMLVIRKMIVSDYPFLEHDPAMVQSWTSLFPTTHEKYLSKYKSLVSKY